MITLSLTLQSDDLEAQAIQEISEHFGYPATISQDVTVTADDGSTSVQSQSVQNPQSKVDFCKRAVADWLGAIVRERILSKQMNAAREQVSAALAATQVS